MLKKKQISSCPNFQTDLSKSQLNLTCQAGSFSYDNTPSSWPVCVPYLECPDPPIDPVVMSYDWSPTVGNKPNITVK